LPLGGSANSDVVTLQRALESQLLAERRFQKY
jgi:hypothetical protein